MMPHKEQTPIILTQEEIRILVRETVEETFTRLGIDPDDPMEAQRDFQFVRDVRKSAETVKKRALVTAVGLLVAGFIGAVWIGVKAALLRGG